MEEESHFRPGPDSSLPMPECRVDWHEDKRVDFDLQERLLADGVRHGEVTEIVQFIINKFESNDDLFNETLLTAAVQSRSLASVRILLEETQCKHFVHDILHTEYDLDKDMIKLLCGYVTEDHQSLVIQAPASASAHGRLPPRIAPAEASRALVSPRRRNRTVG